MEIFFLLGYDISEKRREKRDVGKKLDDVFV